MLVANACWDFVLLDRTPDWPPRVRWMVLLGAVVVASVLLIKRDQVGRGIVVACAAGLLFGLGGTAASTIHAVAVYHGGPGADAGDNRALDALLVGADNRWAAATVGSHTADRLELTTGKSVMAVGGVSGRDNSPTAVQFQRYVADGQIRYFIRDDGDGTGAAGQITRWVAANFVPQQVGDVTVYDLAR
jgi:hypothetical protein